MMRRRRFLPVAGFAFCLLAMFEAAAARPIVKRPIVDDPRGSVIARVLAAFTAHADPVRLWYAEALRGRRVDSMTYFDRGAMGGQFDTATFVSVTYTYQSAGERHTRVYHARSGHNEPGTGIRGVAGARRYRDYFDANRPEIIAWDEPPAPGSAVTSSPVMGDMYSNQRKRDAEIKLARRIEADIRAGRVTSGGTLNVYSSQAPCASCEAALQALSDAHDISIHVAWLARGSSAYRIFSRQRHQHLSTIQALVNGGQRASLHLESIVRYHTISQNTADQCDDHDCPASGEVVDPEPPERPVM